MSAGVDFEYRTFTLHIRCENCMRDAVMGVAVPDTEGAPADADELRDSAALANVPFHCINCESVIGQLTGISEGVGKQ